MSFLNRLFGRSSSDNDSASSVRMATPPVSAALPEVQGLLIMTQRRLDNTSILVQQIMSQQRNEGRAVAVRFSARVVTAGSSLNDQAYLYATLRTEFNHLDSLDLLDRTRVYSFQAPDGNRGKYYVILNRP